MCPHDDHLLQQILLCHEYNTLLNLENLQYGDEYNPIYLLKLENLQYGNEYYHMSAINRNNVAGRSDRIGALTTANKYFGLRCIYWAIDRRPKRCRTPLDWPGRGRDSYENMKRKRRPQKETVVCIVHPRAKLSTRSVIVSRSKNGGSVAHCCGKDLEKSSLSITYGKHIMYPSEFCVCPLSCTTPAVHGVCVSVLYVYIQRVPTHFHHNLPDS